MSDDDLDAFFRSLDGPVTVGGQSSLSAPRKPAATHPCHECNGTGKYQRARWTQPCNDCFACKGKGYFMQSYADRLKARRGAAKRKAAALDDIKAAFHEQHQGLIDALRPIIGWHSFAASLVEQFDKRGTLSDRQIDAARNALARIDAKRKERDAAKAGRSGEVSMAAISAMFEAARNAGLSAPRFVTGELVLSLAPEHGRNAGAVYVKRRQDKAYMGKIAGDQFHASRDAPADILALVRELAASPIEAARKYGRATGICACCGRKLTDKQSVANGIGPICEANWGI